ncbi:ATP/GTP-binding protein [Salmonella enterica]|nr:ATP/GTP-binding protein [Salmonella enterica]
MRNDIKILFIGRTGVGKTTAINAVSQSKVIATDVAMTVGCTEEKTTTTVGLDYGEFTAESLHQNYLMRLYGVPGQERFGYSWEILQKGCSGIILLADATHKSLIEDIKYYTSILSKQPFETPMIIAIMKHDLLDPLQKSKVQELIGLTGSNLPMQWIDARDSRTVASVLKRLLRIITGSGV